ncbi:hypothetical protein LOZ39_001171 [Ophidiomyces ophidiicola]|uniref:Uncharacterized protein n=1 Tax=Ophidiomyces ophidiicola TaxID=1387563 RepID=A0ACB8UU07_9EURO|nr:uncharacterized protein LOZ57_005705 [Ophidiomyces ophidiicola]KAI1928673.1 hypothetical protein LOZ60_002222 [Ophidiomyces ophidiicola]KAI1941015.1 hypothetical protein LOZ57_005705 [Ophidiomyces ophidiicola]KAI2028764.1 hypothetical protein LOZ45_002049 [Ophidiomyces ophidiicola]KAI2056857.1 hypothetical protein LOZ43_003373 [Ophidiomyces ophidiicola]KAI2077737.1 hypothetical protein LOZ37_002634 [Ophidiomyces ophidiicola]
MFFFMFGKLVYSIILIINAIAILSEDRFLARSMPTPNYHLHYFLQTQQKGSFRFNTVGWGRTQSDPGFGTVNDDSSIKAKSVNLIASVRTVMRIPLIAINTVVILYELILG